jgi:SAM-dependent methyltransferase
VTDVLAVEPEPRLRAVAEEAAAGAPVPVRVVDGVAESLPASDESFDVAVVSLVLCSVVDPAAAIAELHRVLRPDGEVRFYEHVLSLDPRLARWQRRGAPLQRLFAGGCNPDRDTVGALERGGFEIEMLRRFGFKPMALGFLSEPHVIGRARRA